MKKVKKITKAEKMLIKTFYIYVAYFQFLAYIFMTVFVTFIDPSVFEIVIILVVPIVILALATEWIANRHKYNLIISTRRLGWLFMNSKKSIKLISIVYIFLIIISAIFTRNIDYFMITFMIGIGNYWLTCILSILLGMLKS